MLLESPHISMRLELLIVINLGRLEPVPYTKLTEAGLLEEEME